MARRKLDQYHTPDDPIRRLLQHYKLKAQAAQDTRGRNDMDRKYGILEPCAGKGSIVKALREEGCTVPIFMVEKDPQLAAGLEDFGANSQIIEGDFLEQDFIGWDGVLSIISNPPFSQALEILERCFEVKPADCEVIMLLRLAFLESQKRKPFWDKHPVSRVYVLHERPSFTGNNRTDYAAYGWFVWNGEQEGSQTIKVI